MTYGPFTMNEKSRGQLLSSVPLLAMFTTHQQVCNQHYFGL